MRRKKSNPIVSLITTLVLIIAIPSILYIMYGVVMENLYQAGVQNEIKKTKECHHFIDEYVEEMKKKREGHPNEVITQSRAEGCRK